MSMNSFVRRFGPSQVSKMDAQDELEAIKTFDPSPAAHSFALPSVQDVS